MASENDYLTPDQIEAIRSEWAEDQRARGTVNGPRPIDLLIAKLLRHIRALTAPADGEALGREGFLSMNPGNERAWERYDADDRSGWIRTALHLHALGHAAGALSREPIEAGLRAAATDAMDQRDALAAEIARLTAACDCGQPDVCATPPGCARHWEERCRELAAELAEAQAAVFERSAAETDKRVADARADGAREEREACAEVQAQLDAWRDWKEAFDRANRVPMGNDGEQEERDAGERGAWEALCAVDPSARGDR